MKRLVSGQRFVPGFRKIAQVLAIFLILAVMYFIRPVYHSLVVELRDGFTLLYIFGIWLFVVGVFGIVGFGDSKKRPGVRSFTVSFLFMFILIIVIYVIVNSVLALLHKPPEMYKQQSDILATIEVAEPSDKLPLTRFVVDPIAKEELTRKGLIRSYTDGAWPVLYNGGLVFTTPMKPQSLRDKLRGRSSGLTVIEAGEEVGHISDVAYVGSHLNQHVWNVLKTKYFIQIDRVFYLLYKDKPITVMPYVSYDFGMTTMPYWGGVFIVHGDGRIEDLSPEEAMNDIRLTGQAIYPRLLVGQITEAWSGAVNQCQVDIQAIYDWGHEASPYLLYSSYPDPFWAVFPDESCATGWTKNALLFNARTGVLQVYDLQSSVTAHYGSDIIARQAMQGVYGFIPNNAAVSDTRQPAITPDGVGWIHTSTSRDSRYIYVAPKGAVTRCSNVTSLNVFISSGRIGEACRHEPATWLQSPEETTRGIEYIAETINALPVDKRYQLLRLINW